MTLNQITYGSNAVSHLEPYLPKIAKNFELPRQIGSLIAAWDRPKWIPANQASHLRDDDYVVGLVYRGVARAYPLWITDYYHIINDTIAGEPILFTTCERCQSGSAFVSTFEDKSLKFSGCGLYNTSLIMTDRGGLLDRGSLWLHYEGVAIAGKLVGTFLPQIPTFHTTWQDWRLSHPETEVMAVPSCPHHRDARHGHGREEYFSRPGIELALAKTISGNLDDSGYPENEMVLGINADSGVKAYPLKEVKKNGSVVEDKIGDYPLVIFAGPRPQQFTMAAYSPIVSGQVLSFRLEGDYFIDCQTNSQWNIEGLAVAGELKHHQLTPLRWQFVRWHAWFYSHRETEIYRYQDQNPVYPSVFPWLDISEFQPILEGLAKLGRRIVIEGAIINLCLPHEALQGISLYVDNDRLNLYQFNNLEAAEDYVDFDGAWFCWPINTKLGRKYSHRVGVFVLESHPIIQYSDPCQILRLPDCQIQWSDLVTNEEIIQCWSVATPQSQYPQHSFSGLLKHLRHQGYDVMEVAFLPHSQLRVGTLNAISVKIQGDRLAIYKCENETKAKQVLDELTHVFQFDCWIFRSIPDVMYRDSYYEIGQLADEKISWSPLIEKKQFLDSIESYLKFPLPASV